MIQFATEQMRGAIKALWQECFGDAGEYVEFYLSAHDLQKNVLVWLEDGVPVSMLSLLPATIVAGENSFSAAYVYAVATAKAFRGRGISSRLQEAAHEHLRSAGIQAVVTVPASESLYEFYSRRGFDAAFYSRRGVLPADAVSEISEEHSISPLQADVYFKIRKKALSAQKMFVQWEPNALSYRLNEVVFNSGSALLLRANEQQAAAVCYSQGDILIVKELMPDTMPLPIALGILGRHFGAKRFQLNLPDKEGCPYPLERVKSGSVCWYDHSAKAAAEERQGDAPYIGLVLD